MTSEQQFESPPFWRHCGYLSEVFGNELLDTMPVIGVNNGGTNYLDRVKRDDMRDGDGNLVKVCKGVDRFRRPFVAMAVDVVTPEKTYKSVYTMFQRYSDKEYGTWVVCGSHLSEISDKREFNQIFKCLGAVKEGKGLHKFLTDGIYKGMFEGFKKSYEVTFRLSNTEN